MQTHARVENTMDGYNEHRLLKFSPHSSYSPPYLPPFTTDKSTNSDYRIFSPKTRIQPDFTDLARTLHMML